MTLNELKQKVSAEYDRRNLKSRVRYHALDKVIAFLGKKYPNATTDVNSALPKDKSKVKAAYIKYKGNEINGAENSVINEIYNQLNN